MADNTEIKSCAAMDSACAKLKAGCYDEKYTGTIEAGLASELDELRRQLRAANSALGNLLLDI
jgi:hypothetical protein